MSEFIHLKNEHEIAGIKKACAIYQALKTVCQTKDFLNWTLRDIDLFTKEFIEARGGKCVYHGYQGFPGYNCLSKNATIIHGIGTNNQIFNAGDKLTIDVGVGLDGFICDSAFTICTPPVPPALKKLCTIPRQAIDVACAAIKPNHRVGTISHAIEQFVSSHGYQLLRDYGGHGCGLAIHEPPLILNYGQPESGPLLQPGMVLCIEPMVLEKNYQAKLAADQWSVVAIDQNQYVCHEEVMVLVTSDGCELLTS